MFVAVQIRHVRHALFLHQRRRPFRTPAHFTRFFIVIFIIIIIIIVRDPRIDPIDARSADTQKSTYITSVAVLRM